MTVNKILRDRSFPANELLRFVARAVAAGLLLLDTSALGQSTPRTKAEDSAGFPMPLENYLHDACIPVGGGYRGGILALLLRFENFSCLPCLNNFMEFCDSLRDARMPKSPIPVIIVVARNEQSTDRQKVSMRRWADENGLPYPLTCVPRGFFAAWHIEKSEVVLWSPAGGIERTEPIPLSTAGRSWLLHRLRGETP
ncbi:MAG TPA: hypothetical protein VMW43_07860 [Bacteroidota bacterium]|nr:hypothetical protein [Bacteroidota bacterium]